MIKTTTKTNFTKNVKYKVGTIKSVTDLMANMAICEGDDTPLDMLYALAVRSLEAFVHKQASIQHTNMVGQACAATAEAAARKFSMQSEDTCSNDDDQLADTEAVGDDDLVTNNNKEGSYND